MRRAAGSGPAPGEARTAAALGATALDHSALRPEPAPESRDRRAGSRRSWFMVTTDVVRLFAYRLSPVLQRLLRAVQRRVRSAAGLLARRWHRSLQLRVVGTTLVVSIAVVAILGIFLIRQIAYGLLDHEETQALSQTSGGLPFAKAAANGANGASPSALFSLATALQSGSGEGNPYDVVILQQSPSTGSVWVAANRGLSPSIPPRLQDEVAKEQRRGLSK